ncbi:MAG: type II secretion system protein [Planctomycetes bacterium]|nr:type II secretion system protein [Planctomycetota bacterium]
MKRSKGFTLIELLVVISIIALLLSILMPSLGKAREQAKRIICSNHLKTIGLVNAIYSAENNDAHVPFNDTTLPPGRRAWIANEAFRAIMDLNSKSSVKESSRFSVPSEFLCPSDRISRHEENALGVVLLSYGYNVTDWSFQAIQAGVPNPIGYKVGQVSRPSSKLQLVDAIDWWVTWSAADYSRGWDVIGQATAQDYKDRNLHGPTIYRHNEGANILFYDAHTEPGKKTEIFDLEEWQADPVNPNMWIGSMSTYVKYR